MMRQLIIIAVFLPLVFCLTYFVLPRHGVVVYNCEIAEISPDYPVAVKEQCRKLRAENTI
jgi:hypothetical protein